MQERHTHYKLSASLNAGYSYFSKRNLDIYYLRDFSLGEDEIYVQDGYKDATVGGALGLIVPANENDYIKEIFYGVSALYFKGSSYGEIEILKDKRLRLKDSKAKLPLKSLNVMLNSKFYFHYEESGVRPYVELGVGANLYELGLTVTGGPEFIDTRLKTNKQTALAYNAGIGITKEFNNNWHWSLGYNYYGSESLKTKKIAISGLDLKKSVKVHYGNNNLSLNLSKYFMFF